MNITFKSITKWNQDPKRTEVEFYEETDEVRQCFLFCVYKDKDLAHLNSQKVATVGKVDGYYDEGKKEPYQPELMAKLEAKALAQTLKEKFEKVRPGFTMTNFYY